jgi:serine/threonine-protein kinase RsbW
MSDRVALRVPATTAHLALVRAAATALACLADFTYDRITDLHIALDEVCARVLATSEGAPGRLEVTFTVEENGIRFEVRGDRPVRAGAAFLTEWSRLILEALAAEVEVGSGDRGAAVSVAIRRG